MVTSMFVCWMWVRVALAAADYSKFAGSSFLGTDKVTLQSTLSMWDHAYAGTAKSVARMLAPVPQSWWAQAHHAWLETSELIQRNHVEQEHVPASSAHLLHTQGTRQLFRDALFTVLLCASCAGIYVHFKKPNFKKDLESAQVETFENWRYEWYGVPENRTDFLACGCAFLCPCVRWAETHSSVKPHHNFWLLFSTYAGCWILSRLGWYALFSIPMTIALCVFFRCELRKRYNMKQGADSMCFDVLLYTFCGCCAIAQEARHVERSMRVMHNAVWPPNKPTDLP